LVKYCRHHLSSSQNYSWFMQYMNCDNVNPINAQPLGMHLKSFHLFFKKIFQVISYIICWKNYLICFLLLALSFVCSWLCLLFIDCVMTFATLKGRKQCLPLKYFFWDNTNIIAYLTMDHHKSSKTRRSWLYY